MSTFLFDIDGTLRNFESEADIDPKLYSLLSIIKKQHTLSVVTGRTFRHFNNFLTEFSECSKQQEFNFDIFDLVFCEDGHICYSHGQSKLLISSQAKKQIQILKKIINSNIEKSSYSKLISHPHPDMICEASIVVQGNDTIDEYKRFLEITIKKMKLDLLTLKSLTHNRLAISVINIDKNSAVLAHGLNLSEVSYFCDEINDLTIARSVINGGGKVICPSNAVAEIKEIASYISIKSYSYGVTDYLSSLIKNSLY